MARLRGMHRSACAWSGKGRAGLPNHVEMRSSPDAVYIDHFDSAFAGPTRHRLTAKPGELVIERYPMRLVPSVSQPPFKGKGLACSVQPICRREIRSHDSMPALPEILKERACACFGCAVPERIEYSQPLNLL